MRAVAVALILSLLAGCFPHDAHKRTIAQLVEGGTLGIGIGMEYFANTSADCDQMRQMGGPVATCDTTRQAIGSVGVALILAGLVGFIATISTAEDDSANGSGSAIAP
ncbi:MAG TPA: hypothetical protein VLT45_09695 [Kofleriaceae bacterium]|nr:hypothetical protein [Kofleriaceae bacterium]